MSSSPSSSSSSSAAQGGAPAEPAVTELTRFARLLDVPCPVEVVLGSGHISVRQCLALERDSVVRLTQPAGQDLQVLVGEVPVARGEVIVTDETAAVRVTEILKNPSSEGRG